MLCHAAITFCMFDQLAGCCNIVTDIRKRSSCGIISHHSAAALPRILDLLPMYLTGDICCCLRQVGGGGGGVSIKI